MSAMTEFPMLAALPFDHEERLAFLKIDDETRELLRRFRPHLEHNIDRVLDAFYDHIKSTPSVAALFAPAVLDSPRELQRRHWLDNVFGGDPTLGYVLQTERIGRAHQQAGVEPRRYLASYCLIINILGAIAAESLPAAELPAMLAAINKAAFLDMELAMSVYINAGQRHLSFHDPLTNLANRQMLLHRLDRAIASARRGGRHGALLLVDLDEFSLVNEMIGHAHCDEMLRDVSRRLVDCVGEADAVARTGGDEFGILLKNLDSDPIEASIRAKSVAKRLLAAISEPYGFDGMVIHQTASIGIAMFSGQDDSAEEPMRNAQTALHQATGARRNDLQFYDRQMHHAILEQVAMDAELHTALADKQFFLQYQPQVDRVGRLVGVETLIRWEHPDKGLISPARFIPRAEVTGLIVPLGAWVLRCACRQLAAWTTDPALSHLTVAVNVSSLQFNEPNFVQDVLKILSETGADPRHLKLELTESILIDGVDQTVDRMRSLRREGVTFSLDDFGTGYSSLSYLKRLPLDQLKIDQSFVRDIETSEDAAAIVRTIVGLGRNLHIGVIAEGVETELQRESLIDYGCDQFQGYLFGRPGSTEALRGKFARKPSIASPSLMESAAQ